MRWFTEALLSFNLLSLRAENGQDVSLRELESLDVYVVAPCIAVSLRDING